MLKSYYLLLFCLFFVACQKETPNIPAFEKTYGNASENDVAATAINIDQDIFIIGTTCCVNNYRALQLTKMNHQGEIILEQHYQMGQHSDGINIAESSDGHLFLSGIAALPAASNSGTQIDIYLLKVDKNAQVIWEKTIGSPTAFDLAEGLVACSDGGLMLLGTAADSATSFRNLKVMRFDSNGDLSWEKTYSSVYDDNGIEIKETNDGNFLLLGRRKDGDDDFLLMKIDPLGNELWSKTYGGPGYEEAHSITSIQAGGFLLCGHSASIDPLHNLYALKIDLNGNVVWENHYGGTAHDGGTYAVELENGNIVLVGETNSYGNNSRRLLEVRVDADGTLIDLQHHGGDLNDHATTAVATPTAYFMIGQSASFSSDGNSDLFVVKRPVF